MLKLLAERVSKRKITGSQVTTPQMTYEHKRKSVRLRAGKAHGHRLAQRGRAGTASSERHRQAAEKSAPVWCS